LPVSRCVHGREKKEGEVGRGKKHHIHDVLSVLLAEVGEAPRSGFREKKGRKGEERGSESTVVSVTA